MTAPTNHERTQRYAEVAIEALELDIRRAHDRMVADDVAAKFMAVADAELEDQAKTRASGHERQIIKLRADIRQVNLAAMAEARRRDAAEAKVAAAFALHKRGDEGSYDDHCEACECWWPCPTAVALGVPVDMSMVSPDLMRASVDHIIPRARGGSNAPSNLQLAHLWCNQVKSDRVSD